MAWQRWGARSFWGITVLLLGAGTVMTALAPVNPEVGAVQKLLYIHLPVAANTLLFAFLVFVASVACLGGRRREYWDSMAQAAAEVTVLNGTVLLATGMVWAKIAWGHWWIWSPRLCISLILWLMYGVYLVVRSRTTGHQRRALVGAIYGVVAFLNVPLLYLSVKLLPDDIHPASAGLTSETLGTLAVWFAGVTFYSVGATAAGYSLSRAAAGRGEELSEITGATG